MSKITIHQNVEYVNGCLKNVRSSWSKTLQHCSQDVFIHKPRQLAQPDSTKIKE